MRSVTRPSVRSYGPAPITSVASASISLGMSTRIGPTVRALPLQVGPDQESTPNQLVGQRLVQLTHKINTTIERAQGDDEFGQGGTHPEPSVCVLLGSFLQELTKNDADGSPAGGTTKAHHSAGLYPCRASSRANPSSAREEMLLYRPRSARTLA